MAGRTKPAPVQTPESDDFVSPIREPEEGTVDAVEPKSYDPVELAQGVFGNDVIPPGYDDFKRGELEAARDLFRPATGSSLHGKLARIRAEFGFIGKTGTNTGVGGGYKFVEAVNVGRRFVELASQYNITMLPTESLIIGEPIPTPSGKQAVWTVNMSWQITDADTGESINISSYGQGADSGDKALPKAQTNAMKYAILLVLQAAGDDPENDPRTDALENEGPGVNVGPSNVPGVRQGGRQGGITQPQLTEIRSHARRLDLSAMDLATLIGAQLGGKTIELNESEAISEQQRKVLAFLEELTFEEAGKVIQGLAATEADGPNELGPDEDTGAL